MSEFSNLQFATPAMINNLTFQNAFDRLRLLALSRIQWLNLPDTMNERFLEHALFGFGKGCLVNDPERGHLSMRAVIGTSGLNIYGEPVGLTAIGIGSYNVQFPTSKGALLNIPGKDPLNLAVLVRNNYDMIPTEHFVEEFAYRIYETQRSIDVNVKQQKFPSLLLGNYDDRHTLKNMYMQYDGNSPFIFGDKRLREDMIWQAINTGAPYVADKMTALKHDIWNEALTFFGIENANTDKKERLITDEAESNNHFTDYSIKTMLFCRQRAAEEYNNLYGTNITVKLRDLEDIDTDYGFDDDDDLSDVPGLTDERGDE